MEEQLKELKFEEREKKEAELKAAKERQDALSDLGRGVCLNWYLVTISQTFDLHPSKLPAVISGKICQISSSLNNNLF